MTETTNGDESGAEPVGGVMFTFLREQRSGATCSELDETIRELTKAVQEHGKSGSVTLTIKVKPLRNSANGVEILDDINKAIPEADRGGSIMFVDENGRLHRSDPNQLQFDQPLKVIETNAGEPVMLNEGTGEVREIK